MIPRHKDDKVGLGWTMHELTEEEKAQAMKAYNEQFSNPYRAAELGFIDEIIMPRQTRYKLIQALEMAKNKSQSNPPKKHGNMPL